jgi:D-alanyl-D-alanine carboxypeptidase
LAFDALDHRRMSLAQSLPVSAHAAGMSPSKLGLAAGGRIRAEDAILGLVTRSANDAAVVLAEALAGDEARFAEVMTRRARQLGMSRTTFRNASGLPHPAQITTARDMATLGRALIRDFPHHYPYFSRQSFTYGRSVIPNHNRMLYGYPGADGIKTGFIRASGFNLVASAKRDGRRLIGVIMGGHSPSHRDAAMARMFDRGFGGAAPAVVADAPPSRPAGPPIRVVSRDPAPAPASNRQRGGADWMIQLGAFQRMPQALDVARQAVGQLRQPGLAPIVSESRSANGVLYRARIAGMTEAQARDACRSFGGRSACLPIPPG